MQVNSHSILNRLKLTYCSIQLEAKKHERRIISIIFEMLHLFLKNGIGPNYYLLAGMADQKMSWQKKCQHLSHANYHKAINILNPKPYRKITQNKLTEKSLLTLSNISTADFIGFYHPVKGFDRLGEQLISIDELSALLSQYQEKTICLKLPEGSGGAGFLAGKIQKSTNHDLYLKPLNEKSSKALSKILADYRDVIATEGLLFEAYIEQNEQYAKFNPSSVNTVRTWVLQHGNNIAVIGALFRIGRVKSSTDNSASGGLVCPIDIKNGMLAEALTTASSYRDDLCSHPDSDVQLKGEILTQWQEIIDCSCETLRKLPYTHFVGLDVCMTDKGPLIIEVNVAPDKDGAAHAGIPSYLLLQAAKELSAKA